MPNLTRALSARAMSSLRSLQTYPTDITHLNTHPLGLELVINGLRLTDLGVSPEDEERLGPPVYRDGISTLLYKLKKDTLGSPDFRLSQLQKALAQYHISLEEVGSSQDEIEYLINNWYSIIGQRVVRQLRDPRLSVGGFQYWVVQLDYVLRNGSTTLEKLGITEEELDQIRRRAYLYDAQKMLNNAYQTPNIQGRELLPQVRLLVVQGGLRLAHLGTSRAKLKEFRRLTFLNDAKTYLFNLRKWEDTLRVEYWYDSLLKAIRGGKLSLSEVETSLEEMEQLRLAIESLRASRRKRQRRNKP